MKKKSFLSITPESGVKGTTRVNVEAEPNHLFKPRSTSLDLSASGGTLKRLVVNQDGIPIMPVVGITCNKDDFEGNNVVIDFHAEGFSVDSRENDNGYEWDVQYLSVKMKSSLPNPSKYTDTYWFARGALLLSDSFEEVWEYPFSLGVFMQTVTKSASGKYFYNIVSSDPEASLPGYTAHYCRMSDGFVYPDTLQYIRFFLGDPDRQGEFICISEFDFT